MKHDTYPQAFVDVGLSEEDSLFPAMGCVEYEPELRRLIAYYLWMKRLALNSAQLRVSLDSVLRPIVTELDGLESGADIVHGMSKRQACEFLRFFLKLVAPAVQRIGEVEDVLLTSSLISPKLESCVWLQPLDVVLFRREDLADEQLQTIGRNIARCLHRGCDREAHQAYVRIVLKRIGSAAQSAYRKELDRLRE